MKNFQADIWKDISGYQGKYQVSYSGQIKRVYGNGKTRLLKPFKKLEKGKSKRRDRLYVHLSDKTGKRHMIGVHTIVALQFLGKPLPGKVPYHINGCVMDNWASNLAYIDREELGRVTGAASKRQPVAKINRSGEIVECYSSARECARQNYMSYQTVTDRCNLKYIKRSIFAPDGYAYAWEDERSLNAVIRRIEIETMDEDQDIINRLSQSSLATPFDI
jgi:hypothetical protein